MKTTLILLLLAYSATSFANTSKGTKQFADNFKSEASLEVFVTQLLISTEIKDSESVKRKIDKSTRGLFFHQAATNTPIVSEFIYQSLNSPQAVAKLLSIFLKRNALIIFFLGLVFSFILAHYLGEIKFYFKPLSKWRVGYSLVRFLTVNSLRVWLFVLLFADNFEPITKVYISSVTQVKASHPTLFQVTQYLTEMI